MSAAELQPRLGRLQTHSYDDQDRSGGPTIDTLRDVHEIWGYVAIVANGVAGVVALAAWRWTAVPRRGVWGLTIAAEVAMLVQVVTGVILVSDDRFIVARFHMFYGFVAFVTIGLVYSYRQQMRGRVELLYGLAGLFIMGLGIRALMQVVG